MSDRFFFVCLSMIFCFFIRDIIKMINLQEFLDGYKTSQVNLWEKVWKFREPKMKDAKLPIKQMLEKYCIEWDWKELLDILQTDIPLSQQKEIIKKILEELGLA